MIGLLIDLIILCIVGGIFWYILNLLPIPAPFKNIAIALFFVDCSARGGEFPAADGWDAWGMAQMIWIAPNAKRRRPCELRRHQTIEF